MEDPPDPEPAGDAPQQWAFYSLWPRMPAASFAAAEEKAAPEDDARVFVLTNG